MNIGELSKLSGVSRDTIRYYEKLALLPDAARHCSNDYKLYTPSHLNSLRQVMALKAVGFTLSEIKEFGTATQSPISCEGLPSKLAAKLAEVDQAIANLQRHKVALMTMQSNCCSACAPGDFGLPTCVPAPVAACCN